MQLTRKYSTSLFRTLWTLSVVLMVIVLGYLISFFVVDENNKIRSLEKDQQSFHEFVKAQKSVDLGLLLLLAGQKDQGIHEIQQYLLETDNAANNLTIQMSQEIMDAFDVYISYRNIVDGLMINVKKIDSNESKAQILKAISLSNILTEKERRIKSHTQEQIILIQEKTTRMTQSSYWIYGFLSVLLLIILGRRLFEWNQEDQDKNMELQEEIERKDKIIETTARLSAVGEMMASIAHEINNPLAIIGGKGHNIISSLNKGETNTSKIKDGVDRILAMVDKIDKIIRGLKAAARDGSNLPFEKESLQKILDETLEVSRFRFSKVNIPLEIEIPDQEILFECRSVQISQILINLLNNAFDAIQELPEKWVQLKVQALPTHIEIRVIDSGKGIPIKIRQKIMQPFFTTKEAGKGTGLGLSLIARIVQDHQGTVFVDEKYSNTCFVVQLPYARNQKGGVANTNSNSPQSTEAQSPIHGHKSTMETSSQNPEKIFSAA